MTQPAKPVGSAVGKPPAVGILPGYSQTTVELTGGASMHDALRLLEAVKPPPAVAKPHLRSAGLRSSEFWLCSFCACVGSALALWSASPLDLAGAMLLGLATASYAWSRGKAKGRSIVQGKL